MQCTCKTYLSMNMTQTTSDNASQFSQLLNHNNFVIFVLLICHKTVIFSDVI